MTLYVATSNPGKLRDFENAATRLITILALPHLAQITPPEEDQSTFEGNATLKARFYSLRAPGLIVLADDSGLEVDALNGAPGVRSARYADDQAHPRFDTAQTPDTRNNLCLLEALASHPNRQARYRCVLAAARDGEILRTASGTLDGKILNAPIGAGGFGYDPLFYLPSHERTMAQLDPATRLNLSHRGQALKTLLPLLRALPK